MKKIGLSLLLVLALAGCQQNTNETVDSSAPTANTTASSEDSSRTTELLSYKYDSEAHPLWIVVTESNDLMAAEGNYETVVTMESVIENEYRQELQQFYDEGYALTLQLEDNRPTGIIEIKKPNEDTQTLDVGVKNLDYELGQSNANQISEAEQTEKSAQLMPTEASSSSLAVNSYEEAEAAARENLNVAEEDTSYQFYDFGMQNDGREYYYLMYRVDDGSENYLKVYTDTGDVSLE